MKSNSDLGKAEASASGESSGPLKTAEIECAEQPNDGAECEYGFCPRERVCFHYCDLHHESICLKPHVFGIQI